MSAHNNITQKFEQAIVAWLKDPQTDLGDVPKANVFAGLSRGVNAEDIALPENSNPLPNVVVRALGFRQEPSYSGSWLGNVEIRVHSDGDQTSEAAHQERAGKVFNVFLNTDITAQLSGALEDFTCEKLAVHEQGYVFEGRRWASFLIAEVEGCGAEIG